MLRSVCPRERGALFTRFSAELQRLGIELRALRFVALGGVFELRFDGAKVLLGAKGIVGAAMQRHVVDAVRAARGEGVAVVKLEMAGFAATPPRLVDKCTASVVALKDGAADGGRNMSTAGS